MWLTILLRCLPYLIAGAVGFYGAWQIQDIRIEHRNIEITNIQGKFSLCQSANERNECTIEQLKKDATNTNKLCAQRIYLRTKLADRIQKIENINSQEGKKNETDVVTNDLLAELNGMFRAKANSQDGIY